MRNSSQVSNLLRKERLESGSMMTPPNPSSKTDARSSFEGVRIAKHAMKKATKKARFLESAFVLLLRWSFLFPFAHRNRSSFSLSFSLLNAQIRTTEIRRTHESSVSKQLGESAENDEEDRSKDGTTKKTTKKSTTTTTTNDNNNVDIDDDDDDVQKKKKKRKMMTPARLRQTQGKHHAGGGGQERSKKSIHGGGKNSGGVVKEKLRNKKGGKNRK